MSGLVPCYVRLPSFRLTDIKKINAFITGSFAIGIISGAYSTEVFRGAVQSIDKGQFEAACPGKV